MKKTKSTVNPFYEVVRGLLRERLALVLDKKTPEYTDIRHLYYQARKIYKAMTDEDDVPGEYNNYIGAVNKFCQKHSHEIGVPEAFWWVLRDKMNIMAKPMAICDGEAGRFLIDHDNRERVQKHSSFILLCEKDTVSRQLLEELRKIGYKVNLISSQGQDTADTKAAVISAVADLETENFFILYLHDYDVAGAEMFFNLYSYYQKVIDIGLNEHFIKSMKISKKKVEERVKVKTQRRKLARYVTEYKYADIVDLDYICGKVDPKTGERSGDAKLIEIDNVHVYYGIKPFIKYIKLRLADVDCWDLTRIGIEKKSLKEGDNRYEEAVKETWVNAVASYRIKTREMAETFNEIHKIVAKALPRNRKIVELENKHFNMDEGFKVRWRSLKNEELERMKVSYKMPMEKKWVKDYAGKIDAEVNKKITCWPGDVTKAKDDIEKIVDETQDTLDKAKENDPLLKTFKEKLEKLDWGKDELEEIEIPDPIEEMQKVIRALYARITELKNND